MHFGSRKKQILAIAALVIVCGFGYFIGVRYIANAQMSLGSIDDCFITPAPGAPNTTPACLNDSIEKLLRSYSVGDIMTYITATTTASTVVNSCHPIGHIVGENSYKKYGSIEQALSQCTSACRSACTHGVIGAGVLAQMGEIYSEDDVAHMGTAELKKIGTSYCKNSDSTCHAIGHVAYIAAGEDMPALGVCDTVASSTLRREACYQGVFMERSGAFLNVLFATEEEKQPETRSGDYTYPCSALPQQYRNACYLFLSAYQKPLFIADGIDTPAARLEKAIQACESLTAHDRADCFTGIGISSDLFGYLNADAAALESLCDQLTESSDRTACTLGVVPRFLYAAQSEMYGYCEAIKEEERRNICYQGAFKWLEVKSHAKNDPELICGNNAICLKRYEIFTQTRSTVPDYRFGLFGVPKVVGQ